MNNSIYLNLKNIWLLFLMAFAGAFCPKVHAGGNQERGFANFEKVMKHKIEWMHKNLDLTSSQLNEINAFQRDILGKARGLKSSANLDQKAKRHQLNILKDDFNSQVRSVLTPDQVTKYDNYLMDMRNKSMEKMDAY